jgi:putative ABC transport system ATP-binding protein
VIVVAARGLVKTYGSGRAARRILDGADIEAGAGELVAVVGRSGSGKSTLLHLLGALDRPEMGTIEVAGRRLDGRPERELTRVRRDHVGFVFQAYNLMPTLTVAQNVELPVRLAGRRPDSARVRAIIERVGLGARAGHRPHQLSGGERQRVAIARALVTEPAVIFADEPTGALDTHVAADVLVLLREAVRDDGQTVVMVTHDPVAAAYAERVVFLADGLVVGELADPTAERVAERLTELRALVLQ